MAESFSYQIPSYEPHNVVSVGWDPNKRMFFVHVVKRENRSGPIVEELRSESPDLRVLVEYTELHFAEVKWAVIATLMDDAS